MHFKKIKNKYGDVDQMANYAKRVVKETLKELKRKRYFNKETSGVLRLESSSREKTFLLSLIMD